MLVKMVVLRSELASRVIWFGLVGCYDMYSICLALGDMFYIHFPCAFYVAYDTF